MASSKEYLDFVLEQLSDLNNIRYRPMMGEFLLYCEGTLFGGIYDDNLLIKRTESNKKYSMQETIPYPGAKPMYLADDVDNTEKLRDIVLDTCDDLRKVK